MSEWDDLADATEREYRSEIAMEEAIKNAKSTAIEDFILELKKESAAWVVFNKVTDQDVDLERVLEELKDKMEGK